MQKRVVVAGGRDYTNYDEAKKYIDLCISQIKTQFSLIFVSGGCRGADLLGERYANEFHYPLEIYPADWDAYGKCAGPIRNQQMAEIGDFFIVFWDGESKGTRSLISFVSQRYKPFRIKRYQKNHG